jgi:hypothetical protein
LFPVATITGAGAPTAGGANGGNHYYSFLKINIMGKQKGIIPIEGNVGTLTFFKTKEGYMVREKGGVSASRIATDPLFARTRENMAEFGRAGKKAKLLRKLLLPIIKGSTGGRMSNRLTKLMMQLLKLDSTSLRGQRDIIDAEASLLEGFEFNSNGQLSATLLAPFTMAFDRATGLASLDIPAFIPSAALVPPGGATHYRIRSAAALVNFENESGQLVEAASAYLPISNLPSVALALGMQLPAGSTHPVFLVINLEFVQDVNTFKYALQNGAFNACTIVKVDTGV